MSSEDWITKSVVGYCCCHHCQQLSVEMFKNLKLQNFDNHYFSYLHHCLMGSVHVFRFIVVLLDLNTKRMSTFS